MSIQSAIILCRNRISQSIAAATPEEMLAHASSTEFALTVLAEALKNEEHSRQELINPSKTNTVYLNSDELPDVSPDNPEDETLEEKRERESSRGFFG